MSTGVVVEDLGAYDPEAFVEREAPAASTEVLVLRGGERFIASEMLPIMYARMNRALDDIVAEQLADQVAEDAFEFDGTCS